MKVPIFHKFYSSNLLIYLVLLNLVLISCNPYDCLAFLFKIPLNELNLHCKILYFYNVFIIPIGILGIFIETLLHRFKILKSKLTANFEKPILILFYIIFTIGLLISLYLGNISFHSQIPYTEQELEQLRYD